MDVGRINYEGLTNLINSNNKFIDNLRLKKIDNIGLVKLETAGVLLAKFAIQKKKDNEALVVAARVISAQEESTRDIIEITNVPIYKRFIWFVFGVLVCIGYDLFLR